MSWEPYSDEIKLASKTMKETNDCTVTAWSNCFDAPYSQSHLWMKKHGRLCRRGMYDKDIKRALENCKRSKIRYGPYNNKNRISLSSFCKKHNVGRYYVLVARHALCVKDGIVHDYKHGPRRQVQFAVRVYLEGEI